MRAMLVAMLAAGLSTACAPMYGSYGAPRVRPWSSSARQGPSLNLATVAGRWDNVMMLPTGARIHVLQMDGARAEGDIVSATSNALRIIVAAGEIEIAADNVARIDRVAESERKRQTLSGAAHGVGVVGLLGLLVGKAPPARIFAAGAIAGADAGYHSAMPGGAQTIYLAPQVRR